jgi:pimeloyl-ACP methyl ester carboxylesterase
MTSSYFGCTFIGGIDRLVVTKTDPGRNLCFTLVLDSPGLVLADTRAEPDSAEARAGRDAAVERVRREGVAAQFEATYPALFRTAPDAAVVERARRIALAQRPERVIAMLTALRDRADSRDLLAGIEVPTTVICGSQDAITPPAGPRHGGRYPALATSR